jgi:hypothetical protein
MHVAWRHLILPSSPRRSMTRRSIVNLSAFAVIAGGGMLLGARPAAAAQSAFCEFCDKMGGETANAAGRM